MGFHNSDNGHAEHWGCVIFCRCDNGSLCGFAEVSGSLVRDRQYPCLVSETLRGGGTTASYPLLDDGSISVVNSCLTDSEDVLTSQGRAFVEDTQTNAKLLVSFVNLKDTWLFPGNYWVLGLGENYEYAVVGEPTREYGWILSRSCTLSSENLAEVIDILTAQGYDISQFILTDQSSFGCTPE
jgi:lipocalin